MSHEWIAADWGTSNLRLWHMRGPKALDARASDCGMGGLSPQDFAPALAAAIQGWPALPVIACGMVGSRQGWIEAPYRTVPAPAAPALTRVRGTQVWIAGGVMQADPPDVMRGEETQIAGLLAARPGFDGVVCLPGTHSKWALISAGEICHFQTFMTGEIFALLSQGSILRHSLAEGQDDAAFDDAVAQALSQPHRAYAALFRLRAAGLIGQADPVSARSRLSGLLIGWELAGAKPYWLGQQVAVIGSAGIARLYLRALAAQGASVRAEDAGAATLAGLYAAFQTLKVRT